MRIVNRAFFFLEYHKIFWWSLTLTNFNFTGSQKSFIYWFEVYGNGAKQFTDNEDDCQFLGSSVFFLSVNPVSDRMLIKPFVSWTIRILVLYSETTRSNSCIALVRFSVQKFRNPIEWSKPFYQSLCCFRLHIQGSSCRLHTSMGDSRAKGRATLFIAD